jgi:hypothetical protein
LSFSFFKPLGTPSGRLIFFLFNIKKKKIIGGKGKKNPKAILDAASKIGTTVLAGIGAADSVMSLYDRIMGDSGGSNSNNSSDNSNNNNENNNNDKDKDKDKNKDIDKNNNNNNKDIKNDKS